MGLLLVALLWMTKQWNRERKARIKSDNEALQRVLEEKARLLQRLDDAYRKTHPPHITDAQN